MRLGNWRFQKVELRKCYRLGRMGRVACRADVQSALESALCVGRVEVHLFLLRLHHVCGLFMVPFWHGRQPDVWIWQSIAGCLCIAAFTLLCPGYSTPRFFSSRTLVQGFLIRYFIASIAAREKPSLAILAIFNARRMSDCSSCTRPPCLAIVADML